MERDKPGYYASVESHMIQFFHEHFFAPLLALIGTPLPKLNSNSALLSAIRSGRVQYENGVFRGSFNVRISRELAQFATFDARSSIWRGRPGADVIGAAVIAKSKRDNLIGQLQSAIEEAQTSIDEAISHLALGDDLPLFEMSSDVKDGLSLIGVAPEMTKQLEKKLRREYTESQRLNIKNWTPEQMVRLREMIERIQTTSDNSSITQMIMDEWGTSAAKAKFLARQETNLFFDAFSRRQAKSAGVKRYRWSTSHDERVRASHRHLDGKIIMMDFPPVVDPKTGRKAHAGQDFNCRCAKIWMLD